MLHQADSLRVTSIWHRNGMKKATWKDHQYFMVFENRIVIEVSTSNQRHLFNVALYFVINEILTEFWPETSMLNQWRIDKNVSIWIAVNLSKPKALDADPAAIQQINCTETSRWSCKNDFHYWRSERDYFGFFTRNCESIANLLCVKL